jgi:hypothetical protein
MEGPMSIEIRQMVVNATVQDPTPTANARNEGDFDPELFKIEIMEACSELIRQGQQHDRER